MQVKLVQLPGVCGEFGVTAGHTPNISQLVPGVVQIHTDAPEPEKYFVSGAKMPVHCALFWHLEYAVIIPRVFVHRNISMHYSPSAFAGGYAMLHPSNHLDIATVECGIDANIAHVTGPRPLSFRHYCRENR